MCLNVKKGGERQQSSSVGKDFNLTFQMYFYATEFDLVLFFFLNQGHTHFYPEQTNKYKKQYALLEETLLFLKFSP